jgi:ATP/maltotriose-dependent transcriptional regulator MalT
MDRDSSGAFGHAWPAVEKGLAGAGRLLVLTGPAGIGKTYLARRLADRAAAAGAVTGWAASTGEGAPPFRPWTRLFREIGAAGLPDLAAGIADADMRTRFAVFDQVSERLAATGPALLVLDDLHAMDPASVVLLRPVLPALARVPVVVVATVREDAPAK